MKQPKYSNGTRVIYKELIFKITDSYYKDYPHSKGWFYNLDNPNAQAIPESQIQPLSVNNKIAEFLS